MRKMAKKILTVLSVFALVVIIAAYAISRAIDPNDYKTNIAAFVKDKTGRDIAFEGNIKLSLFPWISVNAEKILIKNWPNFPETPFISAKSSEIKLKLLPLLQQKIEVDAVVLDGLTVNLVKDKQGVNNWSNPKIMPQLPHKGASTIHDPNMPSLADLTIGSISIRDAYINWDNQQTGQHQAISNLNFIADKFVVGTPVKINLTLGVLSQDLKSSGTVKWSTGLRIDEKLENFVLIDNRIELQGFKNLSPNPNVTSILNIPKAALNITQQTLNLSGMALQSGEIKLSAEINAEHLMDNPSLQGTVNIAPFNPGYFLKQRGIAFPRMNDANALTKLAMKAHVQGTSELVEFTDMDLTLDNSRAKGSVTIKNFFQPAILFNLAIDTLDVDDYLAPNKSTKPITSTGLSIAASTFSLPLEWLRKLNADGVLLLNKLVINRMTLQDMRLTVSSKNGIIKIGQSAKQFYQGAYSSNVDVDANLDKTSFAINEKLTNIRLAPLLKETTGDAKIGGVATISTELHGQGKNMQEVISSLTGQSVFSLTNGFIKGFSLEKMIESSKNLVKGNAVATNALQDRTAFSEISGTVTINKGVLQNSDLTANTKTLRITGNGNINIDTEQLDYTISTKLLKLEQVYDAPIGIHVGGTFSKPTYTLNVAALLTDKNKAKIDHFLDKNKGKIDKLLNRFDKKLGPGASDLLKKIF